MLGRDLWSISVVLYIDLLLSVSVLYIDDLTLTSVYANIDTIIGISYTSVYVLYVGCLYIAYYHYIDVFDFDEDLSNY